MRSTTLRPTMTPLAQGHDVSGRDKPRVVRLFVHGARWPDIFSSVNDLSRFVIAFMNGGQIEGKQVLSPSLIKQLSLPHADQPGLGVEVRIRSGDRQNLVACASWMAKLFAR